MNFLKRSIIFTFIASITLAFADNQTPTVDTPIVAGKDFPFKVKLELTDFELPNGLHSGALAIYNGKWLFIAGRTNGMHTFENNDNNFPPRKQNRDVIVVDPLSGTSRTRSLDSPNSGLEEWQIDLLSVTSPQYLQIDDVLYITGGYGVDSATGEFSTKPFLTAIDVPGLIHWVENGHCDYHETAAKHIRHLFNEIFQVTGGSMNKIGDNPILLIVGQNFKGFYTAESNGEYTQQIRRFDIIDNGKKLKVKIHASKPSDQDPILRRRDLNVVPILTKTKEGIKEEIDILSGVFTLTGGIWTVPVRVNEKGDFFMPNPESPKTFKQGMNNYICANFGLFSLKTGDMYTILLGGITFGSFKQGEFQTDDSIPFTNQVTAIKRDQNQKYTQYFLKTEYPTILSNTVNPNNPLLFGAAAWFIPTSEIQALKKRAMHFDDLISNGNQPIHIGYVVGGIASTLPNTNSRLDSKASSYIFKVFIEVK
jgi:hypothetical protein